MNFSVKIATTQEERVAIYVLRYAVYVEEMKYQYEQKVNEEKMLYDSFDDSAIQVFLEKDMDVIGCYRLNKLNIAI